MTLRLQAATAKAHAPTLVAVMEAVTAATTWVQIAMVIAMDATPTTSATQAAIVTYHVRVVAQESLGPTPWELTSKEAARASAIRRTGAIRRAKKTTGAGVTGRQRATTLPRCEQTKVR